MTTAFRHSCLWWIALSSCSFCLPACQQKMADQPSIRPYQTSSFFSDKQASRQLIAGTIARGHLKIDQHLFTGQKDPESKDFAQTAGLVANAAANNWSTLGSSVIVPLSYHVTKFPFPVTKEVLNHGRNRYMIYCVVCHDPLGSGRGMIPARGYTLPPSFHNDRLRKVAVGHLFQVISKGYGSMPSYKGQITARDRWAIISYVRALQASQHFPMDQMSEEMQKEWEKEVRAQGDETP